VIRWFVRVNDAIVWGDSAEEFAARFPDVPDTDLRPKSLTFIPGTLDDNPALLRANPDYRANLLALPLVERERLLGGNWKIRPAAGEGVQPRVVLDRRGGPTASDLPTLRAAVSFRSGWGFASKMILTWAKTGNFRHRALASRADGARASRGSWQADDPVEQSRHAVDGSGWCAFRETRSLLPACAPNLPRLQGRPVRPPSTTRIRVARQRKERQAPLSTTVRPLSEGRSVMNFVRSHN